MDFASVKEKNYHIIYSERFFTSSFDHGHHLYASIGRVLLTGHLR